MLRKERIETFQGRKAGAWLEEKRFIRGLIKKGTVQGKRLWRREELYDRKLPR